MMRFTIRHLLVLMTTAVCLGSVSAAVAQQATAAKPTPSTDAAQIRDVMKATWDKPGQPLVVEPVVSIGDHGVASWVQGDRGGRALVQRRGPTWKVVACGGDGLKSANALKETGMPARTAERLAQLLASAEAKLPPQTVKKFSLFDGIVRMDTQHGDGHK